jgi:hypothetical protein
VTSIARRIGSEIILDLLDSLKKRAAYPRLQHGQVHVGLGGFNLVRSPDLSSISRSSELAAGPILADSKMRVLSHTSLIG